MEQIDGISWDVLDVIKDNAKEVITEIGEMDVDERMYVYCSIGDDFFELLYSESDASYIKHFANEEDMLECIEKRKEEFEDKEFNSEYFEDDDETKSSDEMKGYSVGDPEEEDF